MRTPSLRKRVVVAGVAVVALLLLAFGAFVYLTLEDQLEDALEEVLEARLDLAREIETAGGPQELADRLQQLGIPAIVTTPDGEQLSAEPALPRFAQGPPGPLDVPEPRVSGVTRLADGVTVEVFATRAGVDTTLQRVLFLLVAGSLMALVAAVLLLRKTADYAMEPLDHVVAAAGRTAAGQTGERLEPDDPTTQLGRMAVAYDQMLDSLEAALVEARDAEERTRRFVDDAAHQLRTPLATIRGSVEALLQEADPRIRDRLMSNLVRETSRSNRLLNSLLTMARLDQGRPPALAPTIVSDICRDEIERARSLAPTLTISCDHDPELDDPLLLDEPATREVLANLLDNARRHARSRIEVRARLHDDADGAAMVDVRVVDDGPGVPAEAANLVFERFATLDGQGGSGLGLPIARTLARSQGGELVHEGRATFVLRLPARAPDHEPPPADP
jgi:two-component system, OmpR family, sensor kinase